MFRNARTPPHPDTLGASKSIAFSTQLVSAIGADTNAPTARPTSMAFHTVRNVCV